MIKQKTGYQESEIEMKCCIRVIISWQSSICTRKHCIEGYAVEEHLISPLVFIEVHVILLFMSPYFMW